MVLFDLNRLASLKFVNSFAKFFPASLCWTSKRTFCWNIFKVKKSEFSRNLSENCELEVLNVHCGLRAPHPDLRNWQFQGICGLGWLPSPSFFCVFLPKKFGEKRPMISSSEPSPLSPSPSRTSSLVSSENFPQLFVKQV